MSPETQQKPTPVSSAFVALLPVADAAFLAGQHVDIRDRYGRRIDEFCRDVLRPLRTLADRGSLCRMEERNLRTRCAMIARARRAENATAPLPVTLEPHERESLARLAGCLGESPEVIMRAALMWRAGELQDERSGRPMGIDADVSRPAGAEL